MKNKKFINIKDTVYTNNKQDMSGITKIVKNNSHEEMKNIFKKENIQVKEYKNMFMVNFTEKTNMNDTINRQANGIIFEKGTKKLLHYSFEKCYEGLGVPGNDTDTFDVKNLNGDPFSIDLYFEGSVIKLFYHNEVWNVATSRGMDAASNFWLSDKSFKQLFEECVENTYETDFSSFTECLDKKYFYTYLIQHPENTLNKTGVPVVYPLNKVNSETMVEEKEESGDMTIIHKTEDTSVLEEFLKNKSKNNNFMMMVYDKETGIIKKRVKLLSTELKRKTELNGKYYDICLGYLRFVFDENCEKHEYYDLFPEFSDKFDNMEMLFSKAVVNIHKCYIDRNIHKKTTDVPEKYERTLVQLHGQYKKTRDIIRLTDVAKKLKSLNSWILADIIGYTSK